ncbi:NUDIX domain-containing protein [Acetobacter musti]|uniref:NUDIX domain-containing protein n=1 Tax=Acetobacter musti TaxID=864732 RepID=A0ABX0JQ79_9PROT|nr:NUDIX hydrolase [Acetobacter musti]NHN84942.1 NUDIX domain-containing protein [Acetobacter musti]
MKNSGPRKDIPGSWTVRSSKYVLKDRWISVRADDCLTPDGTEIAPFYVLEYPDWVQVVALDGEDHVILVGQYRHGLGGMSLELPAGVMEPGDDGPLSAGARELREETGYGGAEWRCVGRLSPNPSTHNNFCHVVLAQGVSFLGEPVDDPTERIRVVRVPVAEAVQLAMSGGIVQAMHVASLLMALNAAGKGVF